MYKVNVYTLNVTHFDTLVSTILQNVIFINLHQLLILTEYGWQQLNALLLTGHKFTMPYVLQNVQNY